MWQYREACAAWQHLVTSASADPEHQLHCCLTSLQVALLPTSNPANAARLASYALTSAADAPERDPSDFLLQGWLAADAAAEPPAAAADETRAAAAVPPTAQPAAAAGGAPAADGGGAAAAAAPQQRPETAAAAAAAAFPAAGEPLQGWRVLDAREGVRFSSRGERQHFQVPLECRSKICECQYTSSSENFGKLQQGYTNH